MATVQTARGSETYIRVVPDTANGVFAGTQVHLRDAVTVKQDFAGGFTVRTSDLGALRGVGLIEAGPSTQAAFEAGRIS